MIVIATTTTTTITQQQSITTTTTIPSTSPLSKLPPSLQKEQQQQHNLGNNQYIIKNISNNTNTNNNHQQHFKSSSSTTQKSKLPTTLSLPSFTTTSSSSPPLSPSPTSSTSTKSLIKTTFSTSSLQHQQPLSNNNNNNNNNTKRKNHRGKKGKNKTVVGNTRSSSSNDNFKYDIVDLSDNHNLYNNIGFYNNNNNSSNNNNQKHKKDKKNHHKISFKLDLIINHIFKFRVSNPQFIFKSIHKREIEEPQPQQLFNPGSHLSFNNISTSNFNSITMTGLDNPSPSSSSNSSSTTTSSSSSPTNGQLHLLGSNGSYYNGSLSHNSLIHSIGGDNLKSQLRSGYLYKSGGVGIFKYKKKLWFVLTRTHLTYYTNPEKLSTPIESIPLQEIKNIILLKKEADQLQTSFGFILELANTTRLVLSVQPLSVLADWLIKLDGIIHQNFNTFLSLADRKQMMKILYKNNIKGGVIKSNGSETSEEEWNYQAIGSLSIDVGEKIDYHWDGEWLKPSSPTSHTLGYGRFNGIYLAWYNPFTSSSTPGAESPAQVVHKLSSPSPMAQPDLIYFWDEGEREYLLLDNRKEFTFKWTRHFLASKYGTGGEWIVEGHIPQPIVMFLQVIKYKRNLCILSPFAFGNPITKLSSGMAPPSPLLLATEKLNEQQQQDQNSNNSSPILTTPDILRKDGNLRLSLPNESVANTVKLTPFTKGHALMNVSHVLFSQAFINEKDDSKVVINEDALDSPPLTPSTSVNPLSLSTGIPAVIPLDLLQENLTIPTPIEQQQEQQGQQEQQHIPISRQSSNISSLTSSITTTSDDDTQFKMEDEPKEPENVISEALQQQLQDQKNKRNTIKLLDETILEATNVKTRLSCGFDSSQINQLVQQQQEEEQKEEKEDKLEIIQESNSNQQQAVIDTTTTTTTIQEKESVENNATTTPPIEPTIQSPPIKQQPPRPKTPTKTTVTTPPHQTSITTSKPAFKIPHTKSNIHSPPLSSSLPNNLADIKSNPSGNSTKTSPPLKPVSNVNNNNNNQTRNNQTARKFSSPIVASTMLLQETKESYHHISLNATTPGTNTPNFTRADSNSSLSEFIENSTPLGSVIGPSEDEAMKNRTSLAKVKSSEKVSSIIEKISSTKQIRQSFCLACSLPITTQMIVAFGSSYHQSCFKCSGCEKELGTKTFYRQGLIQQNNTSHDHHVGSSGSPRTLAGGRNSSPHTSYTSLTSMMSSSPSIQPQQHKQQPIPKYLCESCFNDTRPTCPTCNETVLYRCINALGKRYHIDHFTCADCSTILNGQSYFEEDGKPHCGPCYSKKVDLTNNNNSNGISSINL